jgi:hypothetical protein
MRMRTRRRAEPDRDRRVPDVVQAPEDGPRLSVLQADAADYGSIPLAGSAQVLCVDLYDHDAASPVLTASPSPTASACCPTTA